MDTEQRRERLIAAAMYYFGLGDAGMLIPLNEFQRLIDPEIRADLLGVVAAALDDRPPATYLTEDERRSPAEVVRQMRAQLLRGASWH